MPPTGYIAEKRTNLRGVVSQRQSTRRGQLSALLLIVSLLLPFAQLAFDSSQAFDTSLPACCRAHGRHKCSMRVPLHVDASEQARSVPQFAKVSEKCPYGPQAGAWAHSGPLYGPSREPVTFYIKDKPVLLRAAGAAVPHSINRDNQKRGPPYSRLTA